MDVDQKFEDDIAKVQLALAIHGSVTIELDDIGYAQAVADTVAANLASAGTWVESPPYMIVNKKKVYVEPDRTQFRPGQNVKRKGLVYYKDWLPGERPAIAVDAIEYDDEMFVISLLDPTWCESTERWYK